MGLIRYLGSKKDPDLKYLLDNSEELLADVTLFFDKPRKYLHEELSSFPFYVKNIYKTSRIINEKKWWNPFSKEEREFIFSEDYSWKDEKLGKLFRDGKPLFELFDIEGYKGTDIQEMFEIYKKAGGCFNPLSSIDMSFLGLDQAKILTKFYIDRREFFNNKGMKYLGIVSLDGSDNCEVAETLERVDEKYGLYEEIGNYTRIFMTNLDEKELGIIDTILNSSNKKFIPDYQRIK